MQRISTDAWVRIPPAKENKPMQNNCFKILRNVKKVERMLVGRFLVGFFYWIIFEPWNQQRFDRRLPCLVRSKLQDVINSKLNVPELINRVAMNENEWLVSRNLAQGSM